MTYFDGLGRAWKTKQVNSNGDIFVEKEYDSDGRVLRVCNPYRSGETKQWTTNVYDAASRVVEVDLPDSSTVLTTYGVSTSSPIGVTKQITDQAGRKRKGYTDAAGNMVRVIEDPDTLAYATDYTFDTLGNLRKTAQGSQYRYFMHDSLGRLLYAKQVEQTTNGSFSATDPVTGNTAWSTKYEYNDNGAITRTTDARNKYIEATYDHLGRITLRNYEEAATPDVTFYYDGKGLSSVPDYSNGKTTKVTSSVSENRYLTFDIFGHVLTARQTTASINYDTEYEYNLSGALKREIYPSGRVVDTALDANGDLSSVTTRPWLMGTSQNRATDFAYNSAGAVKSFKFGNNKYENFAYNNRQQLTQIGLGTSSSDTSLLLLEYKYNTTGNADNNGSMLEQKITVPTVGGNSGFTATQTYAYDALNRLLSATESISSSQTWKQEFSYDRYGNKNFVTGSGHTTTLGSCTTAQCNPSFDTATNRFAGSQGYTYDANGSLTVDATGQQYTLDAENRQTVLKDGSSNNLAEYSYDGGAKRVRKLISATGVVTHFVYDAGGTLIEEWTTTPAEEGSKDDPSVSTTSYIYAGGRLISTETSSGTTYVTLDHLGSTRVTTDGSGNVTSRKDFMSFGEEATSAQRITVLGYVAPPLRKDYTGYEKESESGLQFAQARFQNPVHGRFTSVDPLTASATIRNPQSFNRYTYVLNSPYKFVDPLGLRARFSSGPSDAPEGKSGAFSGGGRNADLDWITGNNLENQDGVSETEGSLLDDVETTSEDTNTNENSGEPTSVKVVSIDVLKQDDGVGGCESPNFYGIKLVVTYQVLDENGNPIEKAGLLVQEKISDAKLDDARGKGQPVTTTAKDWRDLGKGSRNPQATSRTNERGEVVDAPYGACDDSPFTYTFRQQIRVKIGNNGYVVRSHNVKVTSVGPRNGQITSTITNGSDINKTKVLQENP